MPAFALALILASQAAAPAPAPAPVPAVRARVNLASYFTADDYPAAALRAEAQGSVFFRLGIGPNGRASDCTVTSSSGSAALDQAACRILRSRVRATPARDAQGNAVADTLSSAIHFSLPDEQPEEAPIPVPATRAVPRALLRSYVSARDYPRGARAAGVEGIAYVWLLVGTDGRVRACRLAQTSGSAALDAATCRLLASRARYAPARAGGAPACDVAEGAIVWRLPPGRRAARRTAAEAEADRPRPNAPVDAAAFGCPGL